MRSHFVLNQKMTFLRCTCFNRLPLLPTLIPFSEASSVICVHFIFIDLHRDLCLCTSFMFFLGTHCRGPPHPLLFFHRLPLLPTLLPFAHKHRFLGFIFSFFFFQNIHRDLCLCASFLIFSFLLAIYPLRLVPMCFSLGTHCPPPPHPLLFLNRFPWLPTIPFFLHKHHRLFGLISSLLISIETSAYVLISWSSRSYLQYIHWDLCLCASLLVRIAGGGAAPSPLHPPTRFYF